MHRCLYLHCLAVAVCVGFSLADGGLFVSPAISQIALPVFRWLLLPALAALVACPIIVVEIARRKWGTSRKVALGILAEFLLCTGQICALLPACM
jgi:hypothetical protein